MNPLQEKARNLAEMVTRIGMQPTNSNELALFAADFAAEELAEMWEDSQPYLQHLRGCKRWRGAWLIRMDIGSTSNEGIDERQPCTCGLVEHLTKYGRK